MRWKFSPSRKKSYFPVMIETNEMLGEMSSTCVCLRQTHVLWNFQVCKRSPWQVWESISVSKTNFLFDKLDYVWKMWFLWDGHTHTPSLHALLLRYSRVMGTDPVVIDKSLLKPLLNYFQTFKFEAADAKCKPVHFKQRGRSEILKKRSLDNKVVFTPLFANTKGMWRPIWFFPVSRWTDEILGEDSSKIPLHQLAEGAVTLTYLWFM